MNRGVHDGCHMRTISALSRGNSRPHSFLVRLYSSFFHVPRLVLYTLKCKLKKSWPDPLIDFDIDKNMFKLKNKTDWNISVVYLLLSVNAN